MTLLPDDAKIDATGEHDGDDALEHAGVGDGDARPPDEPPSEEPTKKRRGRPPGSKNRSGTSGTVRRQESALRAQLERRIQRLADLLERRDSELAAVLRRDGNAMAAMLTSYARRLPVVSAVVTFGLAILEPVDAFGGLLALLRQRWTERRARRAVEGDYPPDGAPAVPATDAAGA